MREFLDNFFDLDLLYQARWLLLDGLVRTLLLSVIAVPIGLVTGLALALCSRCGPAIRIPAELFVDLFRILPPLVLLILLYAGLPFAGIDLGAWGSVALCFLLNAGAFFCEVLRGGMKGVPETQMDAARALGLRPLAALRLVLLPQAVRIVMPDLLGNVLEIVKLTSIASVVGLPELLYQARQAQSVTYNATPIVGAALVYFLLLWPLVRILSRLERERLTSVASRRAPGRPVSVPSHAAASASYRSAP